LVHIGVRSICAGIAALAIGVALVAALAIGVALESVGRYVVGAAGAGLRAESASISVFEPIRPKSLDHRASFVRVASLGTGFTFESAVEESEPPSSTSRHDSFGERFLFDQKLASFDERFAGADISLAEAEEGASNVLNYARLPSPGRGEHAIAQPATDQSAPKLAPTASSPPASIARKRVATAEASKDSISPVDNDSRTAIYDIAARTVYLPNGRRLEAHSGFGSYMDDARYVNLKRQGPTPPNTYKLVMREEPFHGVRAIRLIPVDDGKMFGRDGMLAHSYMLGPNGQSNGCVSFSDYAAFLDAYLKGEVERLVVVEHLATEPGPKTASGWLPEFIKDLFRRS
jgi:type VI secretion system (T6SS) effector TldE1-like protein